MERFIPREKLSRKARKALDCQRRATWTIAPTTRRVESDKRYNRKKKPREPIEYGCAGFCVVVGGYTITAICSQSSLEMFRASRAC